MDELIAEIEAYAEAANMSPQALLRRVLGSSGRVWGAWLRRESSPTMANVDRLRAWMRDNPPAAPSTQQAAE